MWIAHDFLIPPSSTELNSFRVISYCKEALFVASVQFDILSDKQHMDLSNDF